MPKKIWALLFLTLLLFLTAYPAGTSLAAANGAIGVEIDGKPLALDTAPLLIQGQVMVPARGIFAALGASVAWDGFAREVTITRGARTISLWVDSVGASVDGSELVLDAPATIVGGRLMVPLRFVAESLRVKVDWNDTTRTVQIASPGSDQVLKVGLITSGSDQVPSPGDSLVKGFRLCLDELQQRMGDYQAQVIVADDDNNPDEAAVAAARLITQDGVDVLVGPLNPEGAIMVSDVAQTYHVPLIVPVATDPEVTNDDMGRKDYVFMTSIPDPSQGTMGARFALQNLGARTAAVLYPADDYGTELAESFQQEFEGGNGDVPVFESYDPGTADFGDLLQEVAQANPDIIYLPGYYDQVGTIAGQAREMGIKTTFLGSDGWDSSQLDWQDLDGSYFTTISTTSDPHQQMQAWIHRYGSAYKAQPDVFALAGYNAGLVLDKAMGSANSNDPIEIRNALEGLDGVQTPGGSLSINENGDAVMPVPVMQVKNGGASFFMLEYPEGVTLL